MKPSIDTPSTALVGVYVRSGRASVVGSLRTMGGALEPNVIQHYAPTWVAIGAAMEDVDLMLVTHVLILTTDVGVKKALSRPYRFNAQHPGAWPAGYWQTLVTLAGHGGRWAVQLVTDLPKARELWQLQSRTE